MTAVKRRRNLVTSGIVYVDKWNRKDDIEDVSLITDKGTEYRVRPSSLSKRLAKHVWDDVDVEFNFLDSVNGVAWIDVIDFELKKRTEDLYSAGLLDRDYENFDRETQKWEFDVSNFVDRFDDSNVA